jgi:hypothetical protein
MVTVVDGHAYWNEIGTLCHGNVTFSAKSTIRLKDRLENKNCKQRGQNFNARNISNKFARIAAKSPGDFYLSPDTVKIMRM